MRQKFDRILAVEKDGKERKRYGSLLVEGSMKFSLLTFCPPVPIPNTEVKLASAENTCLETGRKDR